MGSHLHLYVGPYVLTGSDGAGGSKRAEFDKLHGDALCDQRLGYKPGDGFAWLPNAKSIPKTLYFDRNADPACTEITPKAIAEQLATFKYAYLPEITCLLALFPDAKIQYGAVSYYI